ncbi:homeobox protein knotted-1-like 3 [Salvia divinorum]|uniref:Homeobox protein knotted-1-like 3 n=1 Tax=Salvia divinorum TaxID=28513 RepID=A0ABD1HNP4_SALDI
MDHLSQEMALQHLPDNSSGYPPRRAILRQPNHFPHANFLNLHTNSGSSSPATNNQWLSRSILQRNMSEVSGDSMMAATAISHESAEYNNNNNSRSEGEVNWRYKAEILSYPLYEQLLAAHVACLRIATPVDQLPRIDAQLAQSQQVVDKYSTVGHGADDKELDQFMTHYVVVLCSFKDQLQQHVRVHAMEAVMACWEIEQSLQSVTGV